MMWTGVNFSRKGGEVHTPPSTTALNGNSSAPLEWLMAVRGAPGGALTGAHGRLRPQARWQGDTAINDSFD